MGLLAERSGYAVGIFLGHYIVQHIYNAHTFHTFGPLNEIVDSKYSTLYK